MTIHVDIHSLAPSVDERSVTVSVQHPRTRSHSAPNLQGVVTHHDALLGGAAGIDFDLVLGGNLGPAAALGHFSSVVISADQVLCSVKPVKKCIHQASVVPSPGQGKVAKMLDGIAGVDGSVPSLDHGFVHFLSGCEPATGVIQ